ncbi:MAG: glycoside hydrolase family 43 protein [Bacteroidales bacterium]|nr:glycoside hydrolase family 43 protein [Bacteroidales bacterium]MBN2820396.1 glycoside hydrolase family 43 protein [Bacteroidales bacterium]
MPDKWFGSEAGKSGLAHFDYFKYKGADDFYRENPLPGDDYFYNPVLPGWNSDPSICKKGGDYFLVTSTFSYFPGVPIFHSTDLVNWKQIGFVLDRTSQLKLDGQSTSQGIFAPAISYNPYNETFYMITTNIGGGNFFVKTKDPFGSWSEPVWLPEVHGIDPSFFFDDDGKAYIVNNDEPAGPAKYDGHRAIRIREFDVVNEKVVSPEKILLDGGVRPEENPIWIEGPHMYKINGTYFLMAAEGGTSTMHSEVILKGNSPMGRFIPWENNPILTQRHLDPNRENPVTCAGHADLVQDEKGEWWSVFLACRPIGNNFENLGRETFLLPVRWSEDNFPYMTQADELIPMIVRKEGIKPASGCLNGNFECVDDFDSSKLGFEWFTLRTPATDLFSLVQKTGYLSLNCSDIHASERKTPAFVARRIQHHKFECETMLNLASQNQTDAAGMLIYKDETHQYFLSVNRSEKNYRVSLKKISEFGTEVIADKEIKEKKFIRLKVISTGEEFEFYFAGKKSDWELLADKIDAFYLSTANSFGFTGSTIGMYATQN